MATIRLGAVVVVGVSGAAITMVVVFAVAIVAVSEKEVVLMEHKKIRLKIKMNRLLFLCLRFVISLIILFCFIEVSSLPP